MADLAHDHLREGGIPLVEVQRLLYVAVARGGVGCEALGREPPLCSRACFIALGEAFDVFVDGAARFFVHRRPPMYRSRPGDLNQRPFPDPTTDISPAFAKSKKRTRGAYIMPPALLLPPPQNVWKELPAPDLPQRGIHTDIQDIL